VHGDLGRPTDIQGAKVKKTATIEVKAFMMKQEGYSFKSTDYDAKSKKF